MQGDSGHLDQDEKRLQEEIAQWKLAGVALKRRVLQLQTRRQAQVEELGGMIGEIDEVPRNLARVTERPKVEA